MEPANGTKSVFASPWLQLIIGLSASPDLLTHFNAGMCTPAVSCSGNAIKQKDGRPARDARQRVFDGYWFDAELIAIAGH